MAKRRKEKDEDEDKPFKLPKFDEEAFLKRERRNIKTTFISFLFGGLMALICFGFWALMGPNSLRWELVLLVGVINAAFLRYIFLRLNIDFTDFARKNWFASYAIYFVTWLIVFIVLVNPPFYDDEAPRIELIVLPEIQELGGTVDFVARITDNAGVNRDSISLEITDPNENVSTLSLTGFEHDEMIALFSFDNPENLLGEFSFKLTAKDINEKAQELSSTFSYAENVIEITSSRFVNITSGDDITIEVNEGVSANNFRVYYKLDGGDEINVNRKYPEVKAEYVTSPEYEGWEEIGVFNMTLYVEVSYYFTNIIQKYSNTIESPTLHQFSTTSGSRIGSEEKLNTYDWTIPLAENSENNTLNYDTGKDSDGNGVPDSDSIMLPPPHIVSAPGFEALILIVALIAVVLIFKYRKKDRRN
jgi:hypothetical protein